ncbi:MAG: response regulator [Bacteroidetes bacterium]|nr:response regulator [Bacteroidota bacterium]HET6243574.1 response regulator [Bacteroidia bacterium]
MNKIIIKRSGIVKEMIVLEASQAIKHLKEGNENSKILPNAILLDLHMYPMDGFEFLAAFDLLPTEIKDIPIYILSSSVDPNDYKKAMKFPYVKDFLHKPLTISDVQNLVPL